MLQHVSTKGRRSPLFFGGGSLSSFSISAAFLYLPQSVVVILVFAM